MTIMSLSRAAAFAAAATTLLVPVAAVTAADDMHAFAHHVVADVLGAKQGDIVLITTATQNMELLDDLQVELRKVGAWPIPEIQSDRFNRAYYDEVPPRFDSQEPAAALKLASIITAQINIDWETDPHLFQDVSPARVGALNAAAAPITPYFIAHGIPFVEIGNGLYPSKYTAQQYGITLDQLRNIYVDGMNANYATVHANATAVQSSIAGGHTVRVTAPNGTDITFGLKPSPILVSDGVITPEMRARRNAAIFVALPAGDVLFSPAPGAGNGTVVFDPLYFNNVEVDGLTMKITNGRLTTLTAKTGLQDVKKYYDASNAGKDEFTFADIGVNPGVKFIPGSKMTVSMAAGMITLGIGNNLFIGGSNASSFSFSSAISNASVAVDGKTIIDQGRLME